jgi:ornithine cyclodeaminase/alanine dehydrogenase-like protein (mu-crystallin family)
VVPAASELRVFDAAATRALLPAAALVAAVAEAMRARRAGTLNAPERLILPLPGRGSWLVMPAADARLAVTKLVTVHPHNPQRGLDTIRGLVLVIDARDGRPLMLLDGPTLTARRTAAVTALGLQVLAREPVRRVALIGTGVQAREHARLLGELGGLEAVTVFARDPARAEDFVETLAQACPSVELHATRSLEEALSTAQAVVTLTTASHPVLPADGLRDDLLVVGVGAYRPDMAELPPSLLRSRPIVVDALPGARHESGDLIQAGIDWARITELVDHLDGAPRPGPAAVFKTVGQAAWDLAAAHVAVDQAGAAGFSETHP